MTESQFEQLSLQLLFLQIGIGALIALEVLEMVI